MPPPVEPNCEIRLDLLRDRCDLMVAIPMMGIFRRSFGKGPLGASEAACEGILVVTRRLKIRPIVLARGDGAKFIQAEATRQGYQCVIRSNHPHRGRRKINP